MICHRGNLGCSEVVIYLRHFLNQISSKVATLNSYVECSKFPNAMFFFALDRQVIERISTNSRHNSPLVSKLSITRGGIVANGPPKSQFFFACGGLLGPKNTIFGRFRVSILSFFASFLLQNSDSIREMFDEYSPLFQISR